MRAIGSFLSQEEISTMYYEVLNKFEGDWINKCNYKIKLDEFVKLYINHRSVLGLTVEELEDAFLTFADDKSKSIISRSELFDALNSEGETMKNSEIVRCFNTLCDSFYPKKIRESDMENTLSFLPNEISFEYFMNTILGFNTSKCPE
uniref:EF-hand domain-containing protein n=2 Tax=Clastoptera arizonana TaxID=38151 RepID=A0A1B6DVQ6_9HEMI